MRAVTWMDAYGSSAPSERREAVRVVDLSGREYLVPVPDASLFCEMLRQGGGDPRNCYDTAEGGLVLQAAFASVAPAEWVPAA